MTQAKVFDPVPPSMDVQGEVGYLNRLMRVPASVIREHPHRFDDLVRDLSTAHLNGPLFDAALEDQQHFTEFANWLLEIKDETGVEATRWAYPFRASVIGLGTFTAMPTAMEASLELRFIERLMNVSLETIMGEETDFKTVLSNLVLSHEDTGLFGISPANQYKFSAFADWIDHVGKELGIDYSWASQTFRISFDEMAEEFPGMRKRT